MTVNNDIFISAVISFLVIAIAVFLLIHGISQPERREEAPPPKPTTKDRAYCLSTAPIKATRCARCAAELAVAPDRR